MKGGCLALLVNAIAHATGPEGPPMPKAIPFLASAVAAIRQILKRDGAGYVCVCHVSNAFASLKVQRAGGKKCTCIFMPIVILATMFKQVSRFRAFMTTGIERRCKNQNG